MFCRICGKKISDKAKSCPLCGARVMNCRKCGEENGYCKWCGSNDAKQYAKKITIRGKEVDLHPVYPTDGIFQDFVRRTLNTLLSNNILSHEELEELCGKKHTAYSMETFGIGFALFVKTEAECFDATGKRRYWADKIAGQYYVCSQWWKGSIPLYCQKFAAWLKSLQ